MKGHTKKILTPPFYAGLPALLALVLLLAPPLHAGNMVDDIINNLEPLEEALSEEEFNEEEYWEQYQGPLVNVLHDNRTNAEYIRIEAPNVSITEYHYLNNIKYTDLVFVLTDLLKRITDSGYKYCSEITTSYDANDEVAIVYFEDLVNNTAKGEIHFPEFSMGISGSKAFSAIHHNDISNATTLYSMIMKFIIALSQVEMTKGYSMEYLMRYFKEPAPTAGPARPVDVLP